MKIGAPKPKKTGAKKVRLSAASAHRWEEVKTMVNEGKKQAYSMKAQFGLHSTIDHPKFGLGIVTSIQAQSMEVVFSDAIRSLVHNRP